MRTSPSSDRCEVCVQVRSVGSSSRVRAAAGYGGPEIDPSRIAVPGVRGAAVSSLTALRDATWPSGRMAAVLHGEFDPGSGRTLAACLTHASGATNQGLPWGKAANG